ncbi:MAG TPA: endonuclease/exonuclease/phosphatase [Ferruginibacter sp.]|nr:endonuclease/exonuclease/phosphatase [Ferruginibacter sp.]HNA00130.1 endonuclease/exonuclease/phosphatase [Ferruginibacter sp.]
MKKLIAATLVFCLSFSLSYSQKNSFRPAIIGFYNLENYYDTVNNPKVDDEEFLPESERHYGTRVFLDKVDRLASVVSQMGTDINPDGLALLGVAEIENDTVLNILAAHKDLRNRGWKIVHYNSPDARGVDVALFYNPKYFKPLYSAPLFVKLPGGSKDSYFTRDILYVKGILDGDTIHVMVNHWPSRSGGEERSIPARAAAASVAKRVVDSLVAIDVRSKIVIMGDLNDDPISPSLTRVLGTKGKMKDVKPGGLFNPWVDYYKQGIGTLAYQDAWGLFDQVVISQAWLDKEQNGYFFHRANIFNREFLVQQTGKYKGYPKRTWDGTTYNYGYSDHFPVYVTMLKKVN